MSEHSEFSLEAIECADKYLNGPEGELITPLLTGRERDLVRVMLGQAYLEGMMSALNQMAEPQGAIN